jgi:hypothetical protein
MAKIYVKENRLAVGFELLGRSIQTFPSGLGRADLIFVVENKFLEQARLQFQVDNSVSIIDTISRNLATPRTPGTPESFQRLGQSRRGFIYPQPIEKKDVPGFTKFFVSAYFQDSASQFNELLNQQIVQISKSFTATVAVEGEEEPIVYNWTVIERHIVDVVTVLGVAITGSREYKFPSFDLQPFLLSRRISGEVAPDGETQIEPIWSERTVSVTRRNFGRYTEYEHTVTLVPEY